MLHNTWATNIYSLISLMDEGIVTAISMKITNIQYGSKLFALKLKSESKKWNMFKNWPLVTIVFCVNFCAYHVWGKICPRLIWDLSKVTEVEKRESRKSFLKLRPHFWGRGCRPRPRNEQAEPEKCFWGSLFSIKVTLKNVKLDVETFCWRLWHG